VSTLSAGRTPDADPPAGLVTDFPRLAAGCTFHPYDNGGGGEEFVLATGDGRQFRVPGVVRRIFRRLDGKTRLSEVAAQLQAEGTPIREEHLRVLLETKYGHLGVIEDGNVPPAESLPTRVTRHRIGFPMLFTVHLLPQRLVAAVSRVLQALYSPWLVAPLLALVVAAHVGVYGAELDVSLLTSESYLWIICWSLLSIVVHELGHAAAVARYGGEPGAVGFGLYLLLPTFFADVSQLWRFPRRQRMVVDMGGAYFQQIAFVAFAVPAVSTGGAEWLAVCHLIDLMVLTALNPLFHFDGYWFLADYLAIPKLQKTAFQSLRARFRRLLGRPTDAPALPPMGRLASWVYVSYSTLAGVFLAAMIWLIYRYLSSTLLRLPSVVPQALELTAEALRAGDPAQAAIQLVSLFFMLAFPATAVFGVGLLLLRAGRWLAARFTRRPIKVPS